MLLLLASCVLCAAATAAMPRTVLVTGATGRTGKLLYAQLKAQSDIAEVRALVRSSSDAINKARAALNCTKCDASEGVFYGDVTIPSTLEEPMSSVDTLAIAVGASAFTHNETLIKAVEFTGVENQVLIPPSYSLCVFNFARPSNSNPTWPFVLRIVVLLSFADEFDIAAGGRASHAQRCSDQWQTCCIIVFDGNYLPASVRVIYVIIMPFILFNCVHFSFFPFVNGIAIQIDWREAHFCSGSSTPRHI